MSNVIAATFAFVSTNPALAAAADFGPSNPFYAPSTLPFQAPPFDKIKDADYQPAIEAGMAAAAKPRSRPSPTIPPRPPLRTPSSRWKRRGQLLDRVHGCLRRRHRRQHQSRRCKKCRPIEAPKLAAHGDAIYLNAKLFARVAAIYKQRASLKLDPGVAAPGRVRLRAVRPRRRESLRSRQDRS